jgi:glyoxylase-like metal-dependent hydrolase (beta-lactamase superfamily II)
MKRALKWAGGVLLVLVLAVAGVWFYAFGSNRPIVDGEKLAPGVEVVKDGFVGIFLLDAGADKVALIDAGNDASGKALLAALDKRHLTPASVAAIFLTHGHGDHTAGCKLFPSAQIYALETELPLLGDSVKVTHPLKDGEIVNVGDLRVETFAVPGHTPGSAVYLARRVLFFGDSAGGSKTGEVMKAVSLFSKSSAENVTSLKALSTKLQPRASEIDVLAFAHTGPLSGFQPLATFASTH